jgi:hypothetical protein
MLILNTGLRGERACGPYAQNLPPVIFKRLA